MIPVNKPYLPNFQNYTRYLENVYSRAWLTNNGPMVQELKLRLEDYLGVKHLLPVANGTLAMQLAYKVFNLEGNAVTTPFTFVATSSSLAWENILPKFADINAQSLNLCPNAVKAAIDAETTAIVPVHVYGNPCDVHAFEQLATEHNVKVIYDAAHAFGVKVNNQSVLNFGDASTLSFHATKVFHCVEGGAVVFRNGDDYERAMLMTNFGIDTKTTLISDSGINAKMSEFHAAMGLAILDDIEQILQHRAQLFEQYYFELDGYIIKPVWAAESSLNGAYLPVTFTNPAQCTLVLNALAAENIIARRYFSPSLNLVSEYQQSGYIACPVSESFAARTLCLPLYFDLTAAEVTKVTSLIKQVLDASSE